jgi:hypothetical protein
MGAEEEEEEVRQNLALAKAMEKNRQHLPLLVGKGGGRRRRGRRRGAAREGLAAAGAAAAGERERATYLRPTKGGRRGRGEPKPRAL